jgi:protein-ribulosamine 3-kinase
LAALIAEQLALRLETAASEFWGAAVKILSFRTVSGGCINQAFSLEFSNGQRAFLKTNADAPTDLFLKEAHGLQALGKCNVRVPFVIHAEVGGTVGPGFILMEDVSASTTSARVVKGASDYWERLASSLCAIHKHTAEAFGFCEANYLGPTMQYNEPSRNWAEFFLVHRLEYMLGLLERKRGIGDACVSIRRCLPDLHAVLSQRSDEISPSLLHGDLWSGNVMSSGAGDPVLIDPAVYYGDREADLGMTELFGGFPSVFYAAYSAQLPLADGYEERRDIYNLYHVLHHALLFGGGYLRQALETCKHFG